MIAGGLDLQRGVLQMEAFRKNGASLLQHRLCVASFSDPKVRGEHIHLTGQGPHVQVVNVFDPVDAAGHGND